MKFLWSCNNFWSSDDPDQIHWFLSYTHLSLSHYKIQYFIYPLLHNVQLFILVNNKCYINNEFWSLVTHCNKTQTQTDKANKLQSD